MDTDPEGQWLTYEELADVRGIDRQSARRLASRLKWRRRKDNRQVVRVFVPAESASPHERRRRSAERAEVPVGRSADISRLLDTLATQHESERAAWMQAVTIIRGDHERELAAWLEQMTALQRAHKLELARQLKHWAGERTIWTEEGNRLRILNEHLQEENRSLIIRMATAEGMIEGMKAPRPIEEGAARDRGPHRRSKHEAEDRQMASERASGVPLEAAKHRRVT